MRRSEAKAGFTLIEMTVVMAIVALVASLVIISLPGTGRTRLKAVVLETEALLRQERLAAILTRSDRSVLLDGQNRTLIGDDGNAVVVPRDVTIDVLGAAATLYGHSLVVAFHPDGGSSGAVLRLSREGATYEVRVNWYSGKVSIGAE
jgi:general secretion pathway protein H